MHKMLVLALGAGGLAAATLQFADAALAAKKGSERGFGFIRPGDSQGIIIIGGKNKSKGLGGPDTKGTGDPGLKDGKGLQR
jgi:hypothetical protein